MRFSFCIKVVALFLYVGVALTLHVVALCRICFLLQTQLTGFSAAHHVAWLSLMHCCQQVLHEPRRAKIFRRSAPFDEEMEEKTDEDEDEGEGEGKSRSSRRSKRLGRLWARLYADDDVANMRDVIDVD